eukprot:TRINITY_DN7953_c0_g1_i1.p1 TRINITY_DN7953_c0_g1~~TRINITY_DN7953_c0_g1_i1.p1  ORF type:complete len:309 (-),score=39.04 TRINITY_DN7953_c0_g1_i1:19-945(-)
MKSNPYVSKMEQEKHEEMRINHRKIREKKQYEKIGNYLREYQNETILVIDYAAIKTSTFKLVRKQLFVETKAEVMCGKLGLFRTAIRHFSAQNPSYQVILQLLPHLKGIGTALVFCKTNIVQEVSRILVSAEDFHPVKAGNTCPIDVWIPKGNTGLDPTKTSFLPALNIASKISRGNIEIINDVHLIKKGENVSEFASKFLERLQFKPIPGRIEIRVLYNENTIISPGLLSVSSGDVIRIIQNTVNDISIISSEIDYPTICSLPRVVITAYSNLLAVVMETNYSFDHAEWMFPKIIQDKIRYLESLNE